MGTEHEAQGREMFPTLAVSCRASVVRGEEADWFREVAGMSIITAGCLCSAVDTSKQWLTTIGAGRAVAPPLIDRSKLKIRN